MFGVEVVSCGFQDFSFFKESAVWPWLCLVCGKGGKGRLLWLLSLLICWVAPSTDFQANEVGPPWAALM